MQKMFGLLIIIGLIWFGLSVYTGDGRGGIDIEGWLDPIGGARDDDGEWLESTEPTLASERETADDVLSSSGANWGSKKERRGKTGRQSISKPESVPQAMKRRVSDAYQKSYDRVE